MDFNNVRILGYTHSSNFFGDDVFRFRTDKDLSLQGTIVDLTGTNRLSTGIWTEANILSSFSEYEPVIINGTVFGSGRMESLSFEVGQDIDSKNYTANITISSTGNLSNLTGEFYTGINTNDYKYVNDLAEDFTYSSEGSDKNYTQRIAISCLSGGGSNPLDLAKNIALNLFSVNAITGLLGDYNVVNSNPTYSETIDLINNSYQVDKKVSLGNDSGNYSINKTYSISLNNDGNSTVEEGGEIKGLDNIDAWGAALTGLQHEIQNSYSKCSSVFGAYKAGSATSLNPKIVSLTKNLNSFDYTIDYSVAFDNRKANSTGGLDGFSHEQTSRVSRNENGTYEINLQGSIQGWGVNYLQQFEAAKAGFNYHKPTFRINAINALSKHAVASFLNLGVLNSSVTFSQFGGAVSYSYTYTTDYSYKTSSFKRENISITDDYKQQHLNRYGIFNQKEIIQRSNIQTLSNRSFSLNLVGRRGWPIESYLTRARDLANRHMPNGDFEASDVYIKDINYNFDYRNNTLNLSLLWEYTSPYTFQKTTTEASATIIV